MSLNPHARSWFPPRLSSSTTIEGEKLAFPFIPYSMYTYASGAVPAETSYRTTPGVVHYYINPYQFPFVFSDGFYYYYAYSGCLVYYPTVAPVDGVRTCRGTVVMENQPDARSVEELPPMNEISEQPAVRFVPPRLRGLKRGNCQKFRGNHLWFKKEEIPPFADVRTTVMIRNIPKKYRRDSFMVFLDKCCLEHQLEYDFLYLPIKFNTGKNRGYAFVNCTSPSVAKKMQELFQGYKWGNYETRDGIYTSKKISNAAMAKIQGKDALVSHFARSHFNCGNYEYLPVLISPPRKGSNTIASTLTILGKLNRNSKY